MYIKIGRYTYSCYQPVEVGDLVVLPETGFSGLSIEAVTEIDVGYPADYAGPIKEVVAVLNPSTILNRLPADKRLSILKNEVDNAGYRLVKKPVKTSIHSHHP